MRRAHFDGSPSVQESPVSSSSSVRSYPSRPPWQPYERNPFGTNGIVTRFAEHVPIVGRGVQQIHRVRGHEEALQRAREVDPIGKDGYITQLAEGMPGVSKVLQEVHLRRGHHDAFERANLRDPIGVNGQYTQIAERLPIVNYVAQVQHAREGQEDALQRARERNPMGTDGYITKAAEQIPGVADGIMAIHKRGNKTTAEERARAHSLQALLSKDGAVVKVAECIPLLNLMSAALHETHGNHEEAHRALNLLRNWKNAGEPDGALLKLAEHMQFLGLDVVAFAANMKHGAYAHAIRSITKVRYVNIEVEQITIWLTTKSVDQLNLKDLKISDIELNPKAFSVANGLVDLTLHFLEENQYQRHPNLSRPPARKSKTTEIGDGLREKIVEFVNDIITETVASLTDQLPALIWDNVSPFYTSYLKEATGVTGKVLRFLLHEVLPPPGLHLEKALTQSARKITLSHQRVPKIEAATPSAVSLEALNGPPPQVPKLSAAASATSCACCLTGCVCGIGGFKCHAALGGVACASGCFAGVSAIKRLLARIFVPSLNDYNARAMESAMARPRPAKRPHKTPWRPGDITELTPAVKPLLEEDDAVRSCMSNPFVSRIDGGDLLPPPPPTLHSSLQDEGTLNERQDPAAAEKHWPCPGDVVEIFSQSRNGWVQGTVLEVAQRHGVMDGFGVVAGTVKVVYRQGSDTRMHYVTPDRVQQILRRPKSGPEEEVLPRPTNVGVGSGSSASSRAVPSEKERLLEWRRVERGSPIPPGAVDVAETSSTRSVSEGVVYIGRYCGEAGKITKVQGYGGVARMHSFYGHMAGKQKTGVDILVAMPGAVVRWVEVKRGAVVPSGAVRSGSTSTDGEVFVGKYKSEAGKINTQSGKVWNFWGASCGQRREAQLLVITPHEFDEAVPMLTRSDAQGKESWSSVIELPRLFCDQVSDALRDYILQKFLAKHPLVSRILQALETPLRSYIMRLVEPRQSPIPLVVDVEVPALWLSLGSSAAGDIWLPSFHIAILVEIQTDPTMPYLRRARVALTDETIQQIIDVISKQAQELDLRTFADVLQDFTEPINAKFKISHKWPCHTGCSSSSNLSVFLTNVKTTLHLPP